MTIQDRTKRRYDEEYTTQNKQHEAAVKAANQGSPDPVPSPELHEADFTFDVTDESPEAVLGSEELSKTETKTQTETVHHKMEIEIDIPVMDNPEEVAKKIHEAIHKSSHDSSLINNAIKFNQELRNARKQSKIIFRDFTDVKNFHDYDPSYTEAPSLPQI